jgi:hypothetical protein
MEPLKSSMNQCERCGNRYTPKPFPLDGGLCRECIQAELGTPEILDLEDDQETPMPASRETAPPSRDFFISYDSAQKHHAARINRIVKAMGKSTWFFEKMDGTGNFRNEIADALDRSERLICVLSRGYFNSPYCKSELGAIAALPDADEERRIVGLEVEVCRVPRLYSNLRITSLMNVTEDDYATRVQDAIRSTERRYLDHTVATDGPDEEWPAENQETVPRSRAGWVPAMAFATFALMVLVPYVTYFSFGPFGVKDPVETATFKAIGRDISLPLTWALAPSNLRLLTSADDPGALLDWRQADGEPSLFESGGQFIWPRGLAILKPTQPDHGTLREGIAQIRAVFAGEPIRLLADVQADAYHGFRVDQDRRGGLLVSFVEKLPGGEERKLLDYSRMELGAATTLHDIGISKKDGLLTLWRGRSVAATWPQGPAKARDWKSGAFGMAVNRTKAVQLFRWSVSATVDDSREVARAPHLVSLLSGGPPPR